MVIVIDYICDVIAPCLHVINCNWCSLFFFNVFLYLFNSNFASGASLIGASLLRHNELTRTIRIDHRTQKQAQSAKNNNRS